MSTDLEALIENPGAFLDDDDPAVRRLAVSVCEPKAPALIDRLGAILAADAEPAVRSQAAEALAPAGTAALPFLDAARDDEDRVVVEAVATAYGEIGDSGAVDWLTERARESSEVTIGEAAVASLGSIGDERAVPVLLDLVSTGRPQVRRRAVVALTAFDGDEVEAAIRQARDDRNPMVREVAEMVVGRSVPDV